MQTKASQRGFTVIEMVITLAISIGVIMLGTVCLDGYNEKMMLNNTTKEVKSTIE
ncbi:pilus assembly FimT family protein [Lactobacillus apis]|nr:prepilin-type N-terminal cleavage/methylation domain-containing protein [Lactobacillus apis]